MAPHRLHQRAQLALAPSVRLAMSPSKSHIIKVAALHLLIDPRITGRNFIENCWRLCFGSHPKCCTTFALQCTYKKFRNFPALLAEDVGN